MAQNFNYGSGRLTAGIALAIADGKIKGTFSQETVNRIKQSQQHVKDIINMQRIVYGINTGFGILANTSISEEDTRTLQHKIIQSHSVGVGDPIPVDVVKLMLITKVHALAKGFSGVQFSTLERIVWHIENNILPIVPEKGSVGASGDLAPLAHLFLPLLGLGEVYYRNEKINAAEMLRQENLSPITLGPK
ncbi:MAG: aromatic amino acid lyase, partial [Chitinophagaceae bacterium]|nr:aromatic amino acid lyase [Chitinophagaceae bacterium]